MSNRHALTLDEHDLDRAAALGVCVSRRSTRGRERRTLPDWWRCRRLAVLRCSCAAVCAPGGTGGPRARVVRGRDAAAEAGEGAADFAREGRVDEELRWGVRSDGGGRRGGVGGGGRGRGSGVRRREEAQERAADLLPLCLRGGRGRCCLRRRGAGEVVRLGSGRGRMARLGGHDELGRGREEDGGGCGGNGRVCADEGIGGRSAHEHAQGRGMDKEEARTDRRRSGRGWTRPSIRPSCPVCTRGPG